MTAKFFFFTFLLILGSAACDDDTREWSDDNGSDGDSDSDSDSDSDANATAELVGDMERDGVYALEMTDGTDTLLFECTAENGGLVTKLALNGVNILAEDTESKGSTFWTAPQSDWNWPPPPFLYTATLTAAVDATESSITLTTEVDEKRGIRVIKKFTPDLARFAVVLKYSMINTSDATIRYAPWEISRVLPGGITFFPTGDEVYPIVDGMTPIPVTEASGATWFDHTSKLATGNHKYIADGAKGWLAHAAGDSVFVKSFDDETPAVKPPSQGEIQLYVKGGAYEEVEQMGAYQEIPVGGQITWTVRWYLRRVPSDLAVSVGNEGLLEFVDNLVK